ncbi:transposase [Streptomyces wedmorensis]
MPALHMPRRLLRAAWPAEHPGIEVVCRDRAPFFDEGAGIGAPTAVQVADRFHLWRNLGQAAERCVSRHRSCLRASFAEAVPEKAPAPAPPSAESGSPWPTGHRFADRTRAKHAAVHALLAAGHDRRSIQRQLGMAYRTVRRPADATGPEDLFQGQWRNRRTKLDDFGSTCRSPREPPGEVGHRQPAPPQDPSCAYSVRVSPPRPGAVPRPAPRSPLPGCPSQGSARAAPCRHGR